MDDRRDARQGEINLIDIKYRGITYEKDYDIRSQFIATAGNSKSKRNGIN